MEPTTIHDRRSIGTGQERSKRSESDTQKKREGTRSDRSRGGASAALASVLCFLRMLENILLRCRSVVYIGNEGSIWF